MKQPFSVGDKKTYKRKVTSEDFASFNGEVVHAVMATFSLARDIEWTTRQFVIDMRDDDEEGIGTFIRIDHQSPAFSGEEIEYTGELQQLSGNELICSVEAKVGDRIIATAETGQKIMKRVKLNKILQR